MVIDITTETMFPTKLYSPLFIAYVILKQDLKSNQDSINLQMLSLPYTSTAHLDVKGQLVGAALYFCHMCPSNQIQTWTVSEVLLFLPSRLTVPSLHV